jgi:hypothetical protein
MACAASCLLQYSSVLPSENGKGNQQLIKPGKSTTQKVNGL